MKTIHKYQLPTGAPTDENTFVVQHSAGKVRHFGPDALGKPCIWVELDPEDGPYLHTYHVIGTGWELPDGEVNHEGTFLDAHGFVWHLYSEAEWICTECWRADRDPSAPADCFQHEEMRPTGDQ